MSEVRLLMCCKPYPIPIAPSFPIPLPLKYINKNAIFYELFNHFLFIIGLGYK